MNSDTTLINENYNNNNDSEETKEESLNMLQAKVITMESQEQEQPKPKLWKRIYGLGILLTIVKILIDGVTSVVIKKFNNIDPMVLVFYRSLVNLSLILPFSVYKDKPAFPPGQSLKDRFCLIFRGVIGCVNVMAQFYALHKLPLGDSRMILATRPAFVTISARIFLKEPCGLFEILNILLMLVGVVFVLQPPFIFNSITDIEYNSEGLKAGIILFAVIALASNSTVIIRHLRKESVITMIISKDLIFAVESFILVMLFNSALRTPSWEDKLKIVGIAVSAEVSTLLTLLALKLEEASKISFIEKAGGIIIAFLFQVTYFNDIPGMFTSIGIGLVTISILLVGIKKIFGEKPKAKQDETIVVDVGSPAILQK